jgi:hypothetical protein
MPRSRLTSLQKLIHAFLDLTGAEQATFIEMAVAIQRRGAEVVSAGSPAKPVVRKRTKKLTQPNLPGTGA